MKTFYRLLINTLIVNVTNNFLWFALTFWAYLETRSVLATSIIGGSFMLCSAVFGLLFGTYVDHHKKKSAMVYSSWVSLVAFSLATVLYVWLPQEKLLVLSSLAFWSFALLILAGAVAGNLRNIAMSTTVTMLVPEGKRDKANGMVGTAMGVSFTITSVFSGLAIGLLGMGWTLLISILLTIVALAHIITVKFKEDEPSKDDGPVKRIDVYGALDAIRHVPGLMGLIFFTTFNNFLGGVFMSLMDAYGLSLISVEGWGFLWGFLSIGFIAGGMIVATKGLGYQPLRTLFITNIIMWIVCILFPLRSSIIFLAIGMLIYMILIPVVEATEQTIIQKVVPLKRQGRVFGFAQTTESAASPITSFMIGPIAQWWVIPYMTDGQGARSIGSWFGTGPNRGLALIFVAAGIIGLIVTLISMRSKAYRTLSEKYSGEPVEAVPEAIPASPLS